MHSYFKSNTNRCPGDLNTKGWCDCTGNSSQVVINSFAFSPNPLIIGENAHALFNFTNYEKELTGGTIAIVLDYNGISLIDDTFKVCDFLKYVHNLDSYIPVCPVEVNLGMQVISFNPYIPYNFETGNYTGSAILYDQDDRLVNCVRFAVPMIQ